MELERIQTASTGLDAIFSALQEELRPGRSEWEIAAEVMKLATARGLTPSNSDSSLSPAIIASGPNGALPHSELSGRRIRDGDLVVADIFFRYKGYNSDATRTFAVGTSTAQMKKDYAAVLEAHDSALDQTRAGSNCRDVHMAAIGVLRAHGVDMLMNHSLGHGVGIDIHEEPGLSAQSESVLLSNDVVTDEPGVYRRGSHGIRIEDTLRVGKKPVLLTRFTRDLVNCG